MKNTNRPAVTIATAGLAYMADGGSVALVVKGADGRWYTRDGCAVAAGTRLFFSNQAAAKEARYQSGKRPVADLEAS